MSNPLVSIITIVYNGDKYLKECIQSIRTQTYKNIEYIIVDGGSTDNTLNICKENSDLIQKMISENDRGISDAFNKGIALASGTLVGILNADDSYKPGAVQAVVDQYLSLDQNEGVYYGDIHYFNETSSFELRPDIKSIWKYMSIYHPAVFVSKSVYDKLGGFREDYKYAMDVEFIHRCLHAKVNFHYIPETITNFRLGGTSGVNFRASYREFYNSVKTYNNHPFALYYYFLGVAKKSILASKLGYFVEKYRGVLAPFLSGKNKS
jgi:glycosyltransferase involved in cell wall biosynthesis